jgi:phage gp46-like protein
MSDLSLSFGCEPNQCADLTVSCGDLLRGNDLSTAISISLFSDRRARPDDVTPTDPRGWWADALDGQQIGSRLWLLDRARDLPATYKRAEDYAKEALAWLISNGIAKKINIKAAPLGCNVMTLRVEVCKPDGKTFAWRYRYAWDLQQLQHCETD